MTADPAMLPKNSARRGGRGVGYEEFHPYGTTAWISTAGVTVSLKRYKFTGMEGDEETGLQCHGVRYYAPWLGRWTSADPIGLGDGVNRFGYCHGNTVDRCDPRGMDDAPAPPTKRLERLIVPAATASTTTDLGVTITIESSASKVTEHSNQPLPKPRDGRAKMHQSGGPAEFDSKIENGRRILTLRSLTFRVSREADVDYKTSASSLAGRFGRGPTTGEHEVEGHFNDQVRFRDPENLLAMLTKGLSVRAHSGDRVTYGPVVIPGEYSFPLTVSVEEVTEKASDAVLGRLVGYILDVDNYNTRLLTHGEELPKDKTLLDHEGKRWSPYDKDRYGNLLLVENVPKAPIIQVEW